MARTQRTLPTPAHPAEQPAPRRTGRAVPYDQDMERPAREVPDLTADLPTRRAGRGAVEDIRTTSEGTYGRTKRVERSARPAAGLPDDHDPQDAPAHPLRDRGHARRRRARRRRAVVISTLLVLAVAIWVLFVFFFKISSITVGGTSLYNESVILDKLGCSIGDNLFSFSRSEAEKRIASALPYLETVRVTRMPPGSVHVEVTPSVETYCFVTDTARVITSPSYKVLRVGDNTGGLLEIRGVELGASHPGQPLDVVQPDKLQAVTQVLQALEADHLADYDRLDLSDMYDITLQCEGRFLIRLGTTVELEYKLRLAAQTIYGNLAEDATGVVDASSATTSHAAYYTPQLPESFG